MRQSIRGRKGKKRNEKLIYFLAYFIVAPIISILLGAALIKFVILPQFSSQNELDILNDEVNTVSEEPISSEGADDSVNTDIDNKAEEKVAQNAGELMQLSIEGLNLYNVQVGSFGTIENAKALADELTKAGLIGQIVHRDSYKVLTGIYFTREEAEEYLPAVKNIYNDAFISTLVVKKGILKYREDEQAYADKIIEILDALNIAYSEESSVFASAMENDDKDFLLELINNNNSNIEEKINAVKGKELSSDLAPYLEAINEQLEKRKSIQTILEKGNNNSINTGYLEYGSAVFKYIDTIELQ